LASHRPTAPKGNTSEASHVVRRANITIGRAKHMAPVKPDVGSCAGTPIPIRRHRTDQRASTDIRRAMAAAPGNQQASAPDAQARGPMSSETASSPRNRTSRTLFPKSEYYNCFLVMIQSVYLC
jgi:hypothetical protein